MNVYKDKIKLITTILILCFSINLNYAFNICGTSIDHPWFAVEDNGVEILIVDKDGDTYFRGEDHTLNNQASEKSFAIGNNFFNKVTSKFNSNQVYENQVNLPSTKSLTIKNDLGINVAKFTQDNKIYSKGTTIYEGSNAGCMSDDNYCNADGLTKEYRDYYCDITADQTGACKYNPTTIENCATKSSIDSDGGINKNIKGTVTDYISCSGANCLYNTYPDSCIDKYNLKEYYNSSSGHSSKNINCGADNVKYCKSQSEIWTTDFQCGLDKCYRDTDKIVQKCNDYLSEDIPGDWVCDNDFST